MIWLNWRFLVVMLSTDFTEWTQIFLGSNAINIHNIRQYLFIYLFQKFTASIYKKIKYLTDNILRIRMSVGSSRIKVSFKTDLFYTKFI